MGPHLIPCLLCVLCSRKSPNHVNKQTNHRQFCSTQLGDCRCLQVWSLLPPAKVQDRLPIQLPIPQAVLAAASTAGMLYQTAAAAAGAFMDLVLDVAWLPSSDTCLAVTMPLAVVVFDLAVSARRPSHVVVLPSADFIASSAIGTHMVAAPQVSQVYCS